MNIEDQRIRQFAHIIKSLLRARLLLLGLLIGIPGIYMAGQALEGFLIGVSPFDTPTIAGVSIGLVGVAVLACYLAARRVTTIAPDRLLREGGQNR